MPSKRSILEELTLDELRANLDDYELGVDDRRVRTQLVDALARARQVRVADILVDLSRKRLQELCRSLGLVQSGRRKAELVQRLSGSASPPKERPPADKKPSADSLALERVLLKNLLERLDADAAAEQPQLRSVVSDAERSALRELLGAGGSSLTRPPTAPGSPPPDPAPPPRPPSSRPPTAPAGTGVTELTSPPVELNTAALWPRCRAAAGLGALPRLWNRQVEGVRRRGRRGGAGTGTVGGRPSRRRPRWSRARGQFVCLDRRRRPAVRGVRSRQARHELRPRAGTPPATRFAQAGNQPGGSRGRGSRA